jgi:hypothetical protein
MGYASCLADNEERAFENGAAIPSEFQYLHASFGRFTSNESSQPVKDKIVLRPALVEAFGLHHPWLTWTPDQLLELCATTLRDELIEGRRPPRMWRPELDPNYSFRAHRFAERQAAQEPSFRAVAPCK